MITTRERELLYEARGIKDPAERYAFIDKHKLQRIENEKKQKERAEISARQWRGEAAIKKGRTYGWETLSESEKADAIFANKNRD